MLSRVVGWPVVQPRHARVHGFGVGCAARAGGADEPGVGARCHRTRRPGQEHRVFAAFLLVRVEALAHDRHGLA